MAEKIIGYLLLTLGVLIIGFSAFNAYQVVRRENPPIPVFAGQTFQNPKGSPGELVQMAIGVSPDEMTFSLNLVMHFILLGFIANVGFKLASLGTSLVRPIIIEAKEAKNKETSLK